MTTTTTRPTGLARVDVASGILDIEACWVAVEPLLGLEPYEPLPGGIFVGPWAEDEHDMGRADAGLAELGWRRTGPWTTALGADWTAPVA